MQHLFLDCPDVAAASDWLMRLWAVGHLAARVCCPAALCRMAAKEHRQLWTILRLSFLHAVWCLRCQRSLDPERHPVTPAAVVAVKQLMRLDYARTIGDVCTTTALVPRHLGAHPSGVRIPRPLGWSRGHTRCRPPTRRVKAAA